jgi:hypothetical protein
MLFLRKPLFCALIAGLTLAPGVGPAGAKEVTDQELGELLAQNRDLQQQVQKQQKQIDELRQRLDKLQNASARPEPEFSPPRPEPEPPARVGSLVSGAGHEIRISGETGLAFFSSGPDGAYPKSEFHVDEARIFLEAPVWKNVYFFTGLELATRESGDGYLRAGELYADIEDVLASGRDARLSLRIGRFNIPFGEEYQYRSVLTNPLITHSMADLWGYDTGVQLYGSLGRLQYNFAVQNGGINRDKSLTARLSFDPVKSLHLSASAHRTGTVDAMDDVFSSIWFGGGFFGALNPAVTTRTFKADLFEFDATWLWKGGHIRAAGGTAQFDEDNGTADNSRRFHYYSLEAEQQIVDRLYGAARYSEVRVPGGYRLMGEGDAKDYFWNPYAPLTTDLQRLSVGLRYQFGPPLVWKLEYSWERGHLVNGLLRDAEDLFSTEIGIKF